MSEKQKSIEITRDSPALLIGGGGTVGYAIESGITSHYGAETALVASRSSSIKVDILDQDSIDIALSRFSPVLIFHLAAATDVNRCERDSDWAESMNIIGTRNIVSAAQEHGNIPVILVSTDFVFSGRSQASRNEADTPDPISVYGKTKLAAEKILLDSDLRSLVARFSFPWYPVETHLCQPTVRDTPFWILNALLQGRDVPAFTNVVGNWTSMARLKPQIPLLIKVLTEDQSRILHIGGDTTSAFQVASQIHTLLSQQWRLKQIGEVIPTTFSPKQGQAPRPCQGGLDTSFSHSLGFESYRILEEIMNRWITQKDLESLME